MIIAIDYDETYTADPELWGRFIIDCKRQGHRPVIVTARDEGFKRNRDIYETVGTILAHDDIFFTGMGAKQVVMVDKYAISPDIWIDDSPVGIVT